MASTPSPADEALVARFLALGFDQRRATDTVKNAALSASIVELAELVCDDIYLALARLLSRTHSPSIAR